MTRKEIAIAEALRSGPGTQSLREEEQHGFSVAVHCIADVMAADNPRFDREFFLQVVRGEKDLHARPPRRSTRVIMEA